MSHHRNPKRKVINFAAGPAALPHEVLEKAHTEFFNYENTGSNVMELSHRSATFSKILHRAEADLRHLLEIPENYKVIFLQGGGNGQFSAIPLNFINIKPKKSADYIVTGYWSEKAAKEATKYGHVNYVLPKKDSYYTIPPTSEWKLDPDASYVYLCDNETIHGIEFQELPDIFGDVPIVADCSSNFLSRKIDIKRYGCIFAGAQKNIGPAGTTVVIVRQDLLHHQLHICPTILDYSILVGNNSLYQTPPTYGIYICGLVFEWMKGIGGLGSIEEVNRKKADLIYNVIDNSNGFYQSPVDKEHRSRMNVPFRIFRHGKYDEALEKKFIEEAEKWHHMKELKGHRSVGGIRASIFNAISYEEVQHLTDYMKKFHEDHKH